MTISRAKGFIKIYVCEQASS